MIFMRDLLTTTIRQCQVRAWNTKLGTVGLYGATTSESVSIHYSISENLFLLPKLLRGSSPIYQPYHPLNSWLTTKVMASYFSIHVPVTVNCTEKIG